MQDISTKRLTVDEIINLAAAWHYLIWRVDNTDKDYSQSYSELMSALVYARQTLHLSPTQTSIFLTKISQLASPFSPLNNIGYWEQQHAKYVEMYQHELFATECSDACIVD